VAQPFPIPFLKTTNMPSAYQTLKSELRGNAQHWLITGGAGFIGSHVVEQLLRLGQRVTVLDDLSAGAKENLQLSATVAAEGGGTLRMAHFVEGDITDAQKCQHVCQGMDYVIHLAAMGSVPTSMEKPDQCHDTNVTGTLNMLLAARKAAVKRFVFASSSAVYGDDAAEKKVEKNLGRPLSPYAASKHVNEIEAQSFFMAYGLQTVGLRFFNVFGPRQNPQGAYAAVIPQWISAMKGQRNVFINGDGENTRDFCFVRDVVQAILLATVTENEAAYGEVFNVGLGKATSLNELFAALQAEVQAQAGVEVPGPVFREFRPGDIRHSCADVTKVKETLGFEPEYTVAAGLKETVGGY
jgi:UDP-N-acetylglucosamine 4-epimerase